jgi:C-terminal processing protease CtpA/Prc
MVAQVVDGSPAYEAGVRNGDVLSHVTIHWGLIPRLTLRHFPDDEFQRGPAGTKLDLTLNRGGKTLKATAILRDIVAPGDAKP